MSGSTRVPPHRSLLTRLLATSVLIAVCAVAATAWLTVRLTTRAVAQEQSRPLGADTDVYDALIGYAATHPSWDGVGPTVRRLADLTGRRITLTTPDRTPISGSAPEAPTGSAVPTATVDPLFLDAGINRTVSGRIDPRAVGPYRLTDAERLRLRRSAETQLQCLSTEHVQAEIVDTPSGRPIVRLIDADLTGALSTTCAADPAAARPTGSEERPLAELTAAVRTCAEDRAGAVSLTPTFAVQYAAAPVDAQLDAFVRSCLEESRRTQLQPFVAPPALLFVTGPATVARSAVTISRSNALQIASTAAGVLVLALAATVVVGVRLVRPLRRLTDAARLPLDRQAQVPVTTRDEIGYLATAFNDLSERRRELERQRRAMVADIAHELRTPLTNIRTWLEAARDGVTAADPAFLELLVDESVLLQHVIDDLRDLAAADAGQLRVHPEPTFVRDAVGQVLDAHRSAAAAGGVRLTQTGDEDPEAFVDPVRLRQLVGNLVANAIRHTPPGGSVTARSAVADGRLVIEVADTGPGIAAADAPRVFDRFWRADRSRSRSSGGSGLGLPIARQIARAHGGDLTVTSDPGHGATFIADLPA
ncbi:ATP-binding protein [Dactylosporangium sp. McL0621]|uniref:sensor histidine kinase n=1 Tax=Dactylosporangium sp. McL0621 TaxID=3415678 RepID=UPI003CEE6668